MIFLIHRNQAPYKIWALCLKNWVSNVTFWEESRARFSNLSEFMRFGSKTFHLSPILCIWTQFLYRSKANWGLIQLLHWFVRGAQLSPSLFLIIYRRSVNAFKSFARVYNTFVNVSKVFVNMSISALWVNYLLL